MKHIKKSTFTPLHKCMISPLLRLISISFFCPNYVNLSLLTFNKRTIMIILITKVSWKDIFMGFHLTVVENKRTFMKKSVLHTTPLMHCKARQVWRDVFSTDQGNGSDMIFVGGATKINLKHVKTWRHQLCRMWNFGKFW